MTFDEFIKRETKNEEYLSKKRSIQLKEWLNNIERLYDMLKDFLEEYIQAGEVKINEEDISITEEFLGTYAARKMVVYLGNLGKYIEFLPIGACVIAAYGRVDMIGKNGTVRIVLVDSELDSPRISVTITNDAPQKKSDTTPELEWRFVTAPPNIRYIPIERETFLEQLMQLS